MSDPMGGFDVEKLNKLVRENPDDKVEVPEEITTQMADEVEPEVDLERDLDVLQRLDPNFINDRNPSAHPRPGNRPRQAG